MSGGQVRPLLVSVACVLAIALAGWAQAPPPAQAPPAAPAPAAQVPPASPQSAPALDFSAISVTRDPTGRTMRSRIYVGSGKVRVDPQQTGPYAQGYLLLDTTQRSALLVNPARGYFTRESPQVAWQTLQSFTPGTSPCPPGAPPPGASCRDLGPAMVNGRDTEQWEIRQTIQGRPTVTRIWVDRRLGIPVKWENSTNGRTDFTSELQNVQEGPQPVALFALPPGLRDATPPQTSSYPYPNPYAPR